MSSRLIWLLAAFISAGSYPAVAAGSGPSLLVVGYESDNIVRFDLNSGRWLEIARLEKGSHPRGVAANPAGEIFVGLSGKGRNVVKLSSRTGKTVEAVTAKIGRFGPGLLVYANDRLWVSGDSERTIYQVDPANGTLLKRAMPRVCCNIVGMAAADHYLYAAEYFQRSISRFDLDAPQSPALRLIADDPHLQRPIGIAVGARGHVFVANGSTPTVVEFSPDDGQFVRTFADLRDAAKPGINGIVYSSEAARYYVASGSSVYELDETGKLIAMYNSPALQKAYGIALAPSAPREPTPSEEEPVTTLKASTVGEPSFGIHNGSCAGTIEIRGNPGETYQLQATTDFTTWTTIARLTNENGIVSFIDQDAPKFQMRFYRISR